MDLPKGKIEKKNEAVKKAAVREVEEECGIKGADHNRDLRLLTSCFITSGRNNFKTDLLVQK